MIKVVDRVSLAELLVEADVVLRALASKSFTTSKSSRKKKFDDEKKKECVVDDDENDDDDEDTTNAPKGRRRGFFSSFSTALTKRLHGAYLSFCSDTTATTRGTLTATTVVQKMMNSKDWLAVVTESRLLSKSFSARRAMRCFEDASIGCDERDDGDGMMSRRGIGFEQFVKLLAEDVAKAYDVDAKVVGKRVVATAYAIERRKEEEERRKGGTCDDDDDDDDAGTDDEKHANAYASSRQRMMTTTPLSTTFSKSANSGGSTSSWRVRAERHANRYGRITDDHVVAATRRRKKSAATT